MKKFLLAAASALALVACNNDKAFTLTLTVPQEAVGQKISLLKNGGLDTLATTNVTDTVVVLQGNVDAPVMSIVAIGNYPVAQLVIESGDITIDNEGTPAGTPTNDAYGKLYHELLEPSFAAISEAQSDEVEQDVFNNKLIPGVKTFIAANVGNLYNPMLVTMVAPYMTLQQANDIIAADPAIKDDESVSSALSNLEHKEATNVGKKYTDLTIKQEDGSDVKLSSYIEPGKYTLVDFWASWCGPCRREIPVIKALYDKYHSKGLNVVGVAVWDKPADTKAAIESEQIPWPVILNGTRETTATYGIMGIPCIMLIGPDGTILGRDLFDASLTAAVDKVMQQ
jgi:thiol-disulfide isomerase/thioredoxin